jgi:hypothetical protein
MVGDRLAECAAARYSDILSAYWQQKLSLLATLGAKCKQNDALQGNN